VPEGPENVAPPQQLELTELNRRVKEYFVQADGGGWQCKECNGNTILKGTIWHLKDHLASKHKDISQTLGLQARVRKQPRAADNNEGAEELVDGAPKKIKIDVDFNRTVRGLVELFLKKNLSLSVADLIPKTLPSVQQEFKSYKRTLNRHNMKKYITTAAEQIYKLIEKDLKDAQALPSLMFDSASRDGRHVFSASLRYAKGTEIVERTIGMLTQHNRQSGAALKAELIRLLARVGLTENEVCYLKSLNKQTKN
jgi:hypothetical protein